MIIKFYGFSMKQIINKGLKKLQRNSSSFN